MRVVFETCTYVYNGERPDGLGGSLPMFERKDVKMVEGEVISTVALPVSDFLGGNNIEPCFVVLLDDLTFTHIPVKECRKVDNVYLDD